jgi:ribonuclease-3
MWQLAIRSVLGVITQPFSLEGIKKANLPHVFDGAERVVLNNIFHRLHCRFHMLRLLYIPRDVQFQSLVQKLQATGFDFVRFEQTINYHPRNWKLFLQALLHRSYLQMINEKWDSNERLEFLGDSILNCVIAEHLFQTYPDMEEGSLTKMRSRLVNRRVLALRAKEMHLPEFLLLSPSAAQSIDNGSESIIADAFESLIGAFYLDGGLRVARRFIYSSLLKTQEVINSALTDDNYKSALLEYAQARSLGIPRYAVVREEGPEHDRRFTVEVLINAKSWGTGSGRSKKEAEQSAAEQALEHIQLNSSTALSESEHVTSQQ